MSDDRDDRDDAPKPADSDGNPLLLDEIQQMISVLNADHIYGPYGFGFPCPCGCGHALFVLITVDGKVEGDADVVAAFREFCEDNFSLPEIN